MKTVLERRVPHCIFCYFAQNTFPFDSPQVESSHAVGNCALVSVTIQRDGAPVIQLSGTVAAETPVLLAINGVALGQALALENTVLLAEKVTLAALAGKFFRHNNSCTV